MKILRSSLWLIICVALGFGCQRPKPSTQEDEGPILENPAPRMPHAQAPNVSIVAGAAPNRYQVLLDFPAESGRAVWLVKYSPHFPGVVLGQLLEAGASFDDREVEAGQTYRYALHENQPGAQQQLWETRVTIPLDLEINHDHITSGISAVNRLFLRSNSRLRAERSPLVIQVNEILSQGGTIEPSLGTTADGQMGRPGSDLIIIAKTATGVIHVNGRGDRGGIGLKGKPGAPGQPGARGSSAEIAIRYRNKNPIYRDNLPRLIDQLENKLEPLDPYFKELYDCERPPGNGGDGNPGSRGGQGGAGGRGGRASHVFIAIENAAAAQIIAQSFPGLGGNGGDGGAGGPGGIGGAPGTIDKHHICPPAKSGNPGPEGPRGKSGDAGEAGEKGNTCLVLNGAAVGDCHYFLNYITPSGLSLGALLKTLAP